MSREMNKQRQENTTLSIWKSRKKPAVFVGLLLSFIAIILSIINVIYWNTHSRLIAFLIPFMLGIAFILFGVQARLGEEKGYKISLVSGILICVFSIIPFVKYLF